MAPLCTADEEGPPTQLQPEATAPERRVDGLPPRLPAQRQQSSCKRSESVPRSQPRRPQSAKPPAAAVVAGFEAEQSPFLRGQQWRPPNDCEGATAKVRSHSVGSRRHSCSGSLQQSQRLAQGTGTQRLKDLERVANVEVVLRNKNLSDKEAMAAFRVRNGLEDSAKIFVFDSVDEHIRQALLGASQRWVENEVPQSAFWDFKWCATDCEADYRNLLEGTLYNHFQNNRELTTKVGLLQNLRQLCVNDMVDIDGFFPRCYDMSCASEHKDFILDYRRGAAFTVATTHVQMAQKHTEGYMCNVDILLLAERTLEAWVRDLDSSFVEEVVAKSTERSISEGDWDALVLYSQLGEGQLVVPTADSEKAQSASTGTQRAAENAAPEFGYTVSGSQAAPRWPPWPDDDRTPRKRKACRPTDVRCWQEFTSHQWSAQASPLLQESLEKILDDLGQSWRQAGVQGSTNAWILKPGTSSKGSGVVCMRSLPKLLHQCSVGSNRIVQKYIERPLLLSSGHKFDIRQWVLVRSFQPLQVYMFSDCYLRLCNEPFDLRDLANRQRHITNWTVNKHGKNFNEGAVLSIADFGEFLQEITGEAEYWQDVLRPRLKDIILHCLNAVREKVVHRSNSFELYGFDFLISEDLAPWLLEVNLSPACESRTPWMSSMLERMASQLVDIVQGAHLVEDGGSHWICIAKEQDEEQSPSVGQLAPEMCLVGRRLNVSHERRFERGFRRHLAGELLRRVGKGCVARLKARRKRHAKAALRIQRCARQFLARRRVREVRQAAMARVIQSFCKRLVAQQDLRKKRWTECAVACQRRRRGVLGRRRAHRRLLDVRATAVQRVWRGWALRRRLRAKSIILAWWRRKYHRMWVAARRIQTRVRTMLARNKWRRLRAVCQASNGLAKLVAVARWRHQVHRAIAVEAAVAAQRLWRGCKGREAALERCRMKRAMQLWSQHFLARRWAVNNIARWWRGYVERKAVAFKRACVLKIQSLRRAVSARRLVEEVRKRNAAERLRRHTAAVRIQAQQRSIQARRLALLRREQVVLVQAAARRWLARQELRSRKQWASRRQRWKAMLQAPKGASNAGEDVQGQAQTTGNTPEVQAEHAHLLDLATADTRPIVTLEPAPASSLPMRRRSQSERCRRACHNLETSHSASRRQPQVVPCPEKIVTGSRLTRDRRKVLLPDRLSEGLHEEQPRAPSASETRRGAAASKERQAATDWHGSSGYSAHNSSQGAPARALSRGGQWKSIERDRARSGCGYPEANPPNRGTRSPWPNEAWSFSADHPLEGSPQFGTRSQWPNEAWSFSVDHPLEGPTDAHGQQPGCTEPSTSHGNVTYVAPQRIEARVASRGKPPKRHLSGGALQTARQLRSMPTSPSHGQESIGRSVSRARQSLEEAASKLLAMYSVSSHTPMQASYSRSEGRKPHLPPRLSTVAP